MRLRDTPNGHEGEGQEREVVAIDGKALRRSHDRRNNLGPWFLVSAWSVQCGISLGQLVTAEKSNEITAIPELIDQIVIKKAVATIDAAGCQKAIARKIIAAGGDYILALKGNHEKLFEAAMDHFIKHMAIDFAEIKIRILEEVVKGHGRVDTLTYYQFSVPKGLPGKSDWRGLRTIVVAIRNSESQGKITKPTYDTTFPPCDLASNKSTRLCGGTGASKTRFTGASTSRFEKMTIGLEIAVLPTISLGSSDSPSAFSSSKPTRKASR